MKSWEIRRQYLDYLRISPFCAHDGLQERQRPFHFGKAHYRVLWHLLEFTS